MKKILLPLIIVLALIQSLTAQEADNGWDNWKFLVGNWIGEGEGQPGQGKGTFSFQLELNGNVLMRKSKTEFAAQGNRPAATHEDLLVVYKAADTLPLKAIYFDNEKHVIQYHISYAENKIILTGEINPAAPRFRLVYEKLTDNLVNIRFEMAMPGTPDDFKLYIEGKSKKL